MRVGERMMAVEVMYLVSQDMGSIIHIALRSSRAVTGVNLESYPEARTKDLRTGEHKGEISIAEEK